MEIKPCEDDIISVIAIWPVILICELLFLYGSCWGSFWVMGIISLDVLLSIFSIRDWLYLSRTIRFGQDGCTFSIGRFSKTYPWECLCVKNCDDSNFMFADSDVCGPGILICPKEWKVSSKMGAMTFCRTMHPLSSVYIRFVTQQNVRHGITGKIQYQGHTAEKEAILQYINPYTQKPPV